MSNNANMVRGDGERGSFKFKPDHIFQSQDKDVFKIHIQNHSTKPDLVDTHTKCIINVGEKLPLSEGVDLTLADQSGNALLEVSSACKKSVSLDGIDVIDIAHVRPGQAIEVDGRLMKLVRPGAIFVNDYGGVRRNLHFKNILSSDQKTSDTDEKPLADSIETWLAEALTPPAPKVVVPSGETESKSRKRVRPLHLGIAAVAVSAVFCIVGLWLQETDKAQAPSKNGDQSQTAQSHSQVDDSAGFSGESPDESGLGLNQTPTADALTLLPGDSSQEVAEATQTRPPARTQQQQGTQVNAEQKKTLSPAFEAAVRRRLAEYRLEYGFNPDGVAVKLKALKAKVPQGHPLALEIEKVLGRK